MSIYKDFENYRLEKGISPNTTVIEKNVIKSFLAFINKKHKRVVELYEIKPSDVRAFLHNQEEQGLKDNTIQRKLNTIRRWFEFLYDTKKITQDFMPKFKYNKLIKKKKTIIYIDYEYLLSKKEIIIHSPKLLLYAKMLYLLYMRGIRIRDIVKITLDEIDYLGDKIIIKINKDNGCTQKAIFTDIEIPIIMECKELAKKRATPFLLSSKKDGAYIPLQLGSFKDFIFSLREMLGTPFRSEQIRLAYTHYLYTRQKKTVEDIQELLGIPLTSASVTLKEALERVKNIDYNKKRTS